MIIGTPLPRCRIGVSEESWCERGDSNPHGFTRQILSLVRLPIPPLSHFEVSSLIVTRCRFGARAVFFFPALVLSNSAKLARRRDFTSNLRLV